MSSDAELDAQRRGWLSDQIHGLGTYARVLAGESLSYADEVEECYGVRPQLGRRRPTARPTSSSTSCYRARGRCTSATRPSAASTPSSRPRMVPALRALIAVLRIRTGTLVALPDGEQLVVEEVHDEPWWAFNYYLGDLRAVSSSTPTCRRPRPTSSRSRPTRPIRDTTPSASSRSSCSSGTQGYLEESIQLVPTPQSLVGEGIAELGLEIVIDDELERELDATLTAHGLDGDLARALAIGRARQPIQWDRARRRPDDPRARALGRRRRAHTTSTGRWRRPSGRRVRCASRPTRPGARTRSRTRPARISAAATSPATPPASARCSPSRFASATCSPPGP